MNVHAFDRKRVEIFWWDTVGPVNLEPGEKLAPLLCADLGYIIEEDDVSITFAAGLREDDEMRHACSTIPKGCIKDILELPQGYSRSGREQGG